MTAIASLSIFKFLKHLHSYYLILLPKSSEADEDNEGPLTGLASLQIPTSHKERSDGVFWRTRKNEGLAHRASLILGTQRKGRAPPEGADSQMGRELVKGGVACVVAGMVGTQHRRGGGPSSCNHMRISRRS